jgi:hypothetical protein
LDNIDAESTATLRVEFHCGEATRLGWGSLVVGFTVKVGEANVEAFIA